jgi:hypothetical protein
VLVGLEMDAKLMTLLLFKDLPAGAMALVAHFATGIGLGILYFRILWWNARLLASGGHLATSLALLLGRFALVGSFLTLASLEGALPLLALALGILGARFGVMHRMPRTTP